MNLKKLVFLITTDDCVYCTRNCKAEGYIYPSENKVRIMVRAGTVISTNVLKDLSRKTRDKRNTLKRKGIINQNFVLTEDVLFDSPSEASDFVTGANSNGWDEFHFADGTTLGQWNGKHGSQYRKSTA